MNEEEIKKIAQEEMNKAIMKNLDSSIIFKYISNIEKELEKKDTLINTMQAEFERLENLEDDTDMLKLELKEKDKIIDLMALDIYGMQMECNRYFKDTEEVKQYFERKIKEDK